MARSVDWSPTRTPLTPGEIGEVVSRIEPKLKHFADKYDERKYPPGELGRLRTVFASPERVTGADITAALVWKYGHTGKTNYPERQRALAARIGRMWPANPIVPGQDARGVFDGWTQVLGSTSFITVCFLLHLANPDDLPILDQHNFRSVMHHLAAVRADVVTTSKPRHFDDLMLVRDFSVSVTREWRRYSASPPPSAEALDRYLMMHGKSLKASNRLGVRGY